MVDLREQEQNGFYSTHINSESISNEFDEMELRLEKGDEGRFLKTTKNHKIRFAAKMLNQFRVRRIQNDMTFHTET